MLTLSERLLEFETEIDQEILVEFDAVLLLCLLHPQRLEVSLSLLEVREWVVLIDEIFLEILHQH